MMRFRSWMFPLILIGGAVTTFSMAQTKGPGPQNPSCMDMRAMHRSMMEGATEEQREQHLRAKQEHMLKMHELSDKILSAKDATEKEQLKQQQLDLMKEKMAKMKERMAKSMEGCGMKKNSGRQMMQGRK